MWLFLFLALPASAAWDSVAVFHRPEKVIVLINERGSLGQSRLQNWMDLFSTESSTAASLQFLSNDEGIKFTCGRQVDAASCTFRFLPSKNVVISDRHVEAVLNKTELAQAGLPLKEVTDFDISFLNSNGDQFRLWIESTQQIRFSGRKK